MRFGAPGTVCTVIGVSRTVKMNHMRERAEPQMYVPLAQFPSATLAFVVRTAGGSAAIATAIRDAIWEIDRDQPISSVEPLTTLMAVVDTGYRVLAKLMVFFAAVALFLATIGIYGVVANLVSQGTREIGIRMALGSEPRDVIRLLVRQGSRLVAIGLVLGVLGALLAGKYLAVALGGIQVADPAVVVGLAAFLGAVALLATYLPARRAARIDPLLAMRAE
jgi:putative ABC transport system permease protein